MKNADLAGSWYPGSREELSAMIQDYMAQAKTEPVSGQAFALISPHAGYVFSGPVAAYGYKALQNGPAKTVILIGFSHRKPFDGISVYSKGSFRTPLGEIQIDTQLALDIMQKSPRMSFSPAPFNEENSIETQIPFIQAAFPGAKLVPIAFGTQDYRDAEVLAEALAKTLAGRNDYLIVASTDMSHFHGYGEAKAIDKRALSLMEEMKPRELFESVARGACELCGLMPVTATFLAAEKMGFDKVKVLKYANSGDTFGDKSRVVGYVSAIVYKEKVESREKRVESREEKRPEEKKMLNEIQRKRLLQIARESIIGYVKDGKRKEFQESDEVLNKEMGAFVTLHEAGELRGCIGNMTGHGPLYKTVAAMAIEAATGDPRFPTLSLQEIDKIRIEISVLSPLKRVASHEEIKIPGHGVIVRRGFQSGVYLPQVATETGWNKEEFLTSLCAHKAGMAADAWKDPKTEMYIFTAEVFGEEATQQKMGR